MRMVSPMPSASSVPRPDRGLQRARPLRARLGDAEVQRVVDLLAQQAVRRDRVRHVRRLDRDLEVLEVEPLHQLDELDRGLDQRLDRVLALELVQVLGQRAGVHPDAHRRARRLRPVGHLGDLLGPADVARVQPDAVGAGVDRLQRQRVVEVDVGDDRDRRLAPDRLQRLHVLLARHRAAHDVAARVRDRADLLASWRRSRPSRSWSSTGPRPGRRRRSSPHRRLSAVSRPCAAYQPMGGGAQPRPSAAASTGPDSQLGSISWPPRMTRSGSRSAFTAWRRA